MKKVFLLVTILMITGSMLSACGNNQEANQNLVQTSVAETIVALQATTAANTPPTQVIPSETPTTEVLPTFTPAPTQPAPTEVPPTATSMPYYRIGNVQDITYPDNTAVTAGQKFTKTWRFTNNGISTWTSDFKVVFVSGNSMNASTTSTIGQSVAPNQTVDVSLDMTAPTNPDTYIGYFMLQAPNGARFGFGDDSNNAFWVKVKVQTFFEVTSATANVKPTSYTGTCPYQLSFSATITSSAAGSITYTYVTSKGTSKEYTMVFDAAGTKTSEVETWTVKESQTLKVHIYIDNPNHQDFPIVSIPITCKP